MSVTFSADITNLEQRPIVKYYDQNGLTEPYMWLKPGEEGEYNGHQYIGDPILQKISVDNIYLSEKHLAFFPTWIQQELRKIPTQHIDVDRGPEVQLANSNARLVLELLKYDYNELNGHAPAATFLAKCQAALTKNMGWYTRPASDTWAAPKLVDVDNPDIKIQNGMPVQPTNSARAIDVGVNQDAMQGYINRLIDLAMWCLRKEEELNPSVGDGVVPLFKKKVDVTWG